MAIHDGHRERLRQKIVKNGVNSLQQHEMLEYILYSFIPRKDTNEIAHELINTFGSFSNVLRTDADRLMQVKGMTRNASLFLNSLTGIFCEYQNDSNLYRQNLKGRGIAREFMRNQLFGKGVEQVYMVAVDAKDNFVRIEKVSSGNGNSVAVPTRKIVDFALRTNACGILLAHNHPAGDVSPSSSDVQQTLEIAHVLKSIKVVLQDHFIFSENKYYSFEENGIL